MNNVEYIDIVNDIEEINYTDNSSNDSYHISPFRPEMFGSLIYATIYYLCHTYDIKLVMHGEANMLPMHSLFSDRSVLYNANPLYRTQKNKFNKNREVLIEHIQREFNSRIDSSYVSFGSRFGVRPLYDDNKLFGGILKKISTKTGKDKREIIKSVSYDDVKNFVINIFSTRKIFLTEKSKDCLHDICENTPDKNKLWFCSHHKERFIAFENYVYSKVPELVLESTLWKKQNSIHDIILDIDANSFLSTQILSSQTKNIRFVASGGATTLFQTIPYINTVHLTIWDYYTMEYDDIKSEIMKKSGKTHNIFHVGGILNNSQAIPFGGDSIITPMPVPHYAKPLAKYDDNILNYIGHVGDCLITQKEQQLEEILKRLWKE